MRACRPGAVGWAGDRRFIQWATVTSLPATILQPVRQRSTSRLRRCSAWSKARSRPGSEARRPARACPERRHREPSIPATADSRPWAATMVTAPIQACGMDLATSRRAEAPWAGTPDPCGMDLATSRRTEAPWAGTPDPIAAGRNSPRHLAEIRGNAITVAARAPTPWAATQTRWDATPARTSRPWR